jgi:DNA-binding transcriptional regulator YiaG
MAVSEQEKEYFKRYYQEHKAEIAAKKKERYQTDPEYRAAIQERKRQTRLRRKREREAKKAKAKKKDPLAPKVFSVQIGGHDRELSMYSSTQLARMLGRSVQTIRLWEREGILPKAVYRCNNNNRLYTEFQVKMLVAAMFDVVNEHGRLKLKSFTEHARAIWDNYPYGIEE